ncbi:6570_t:CDS:2, partial [Entrophospora sp. SA101]
PTIPATESSLIHFMTLEEQITRLAEDYKKRSGVIMANFNEVIAYSHVSVFLSCLSTCTLSAINELHLANFRVQ